MTAHLHITPTAAQDIPLIAALARRIWPVAYQDILTPPQIDNMLEKIYCPRNLQQEMVDGHRFWLAYQVDEPVGFASGYREDARIVWLKKIYILPQMQGRGVGRKLMETVIAAFTPAEELRLLANPHNAPAHAYYLRQGFKKIGEVPVRMGDWDFTDHLFAKAIANI